MKTTIEIESEYRDRVKAAVRFNLGNPEVLMIAELLDDRVERAKFTADGLFDGIYWERAYIVAWKDAYQAGTHRVCINEDEGICMWGHYYTGDNGEDAMTDFHERIGETVA